MSGLASLSLKTDYRKGRDDIAQEFYLPCMRVASRYGPDVLYEAGLGEFVQGLVGFYLRDDAIGVLGRREQPIFRHEWREDLLYFTISSLLVQALTFLSLAPSLTILRHTEWAGFRASSSVSSWRSSRFRRCTCR